MATNTKKPASVPGQVQPVVGHSCDNCCRRPGQLVYQSVQPEPRNCDPEKYANDRRGPWVFRYYLCRWCRGAWNRHRLPTERKMTVVEYRPDEEVLANNSITGG